MHLQCSCKEKRVVEGKVTQRREMSKESQQSCVGYGGWIDGEIADLVMKE